MRLCCVHTHQVMMQQLTREQEEKTNHIQASVRCYQNSVDANSKLLEQATLSIEEEDLVTFIQVCRCGLVSEALVQNL